MTTNSSILIVDDEAAFLESTAELLRRDGYQCDCAADTEQALEKLRENTYDVLISDIRMPGNQDLRIVREAQRVSEAMPVILVTAYPSMDTAISAVELPVAAYIQKPVDHDQLKTHVENSIERSRSRQKVAQVRRLLEDCVRDMREIERQRSATSKAGLDSAEDLLPTTIRTLSDCLTTLVELETESASGKPEIRLCQMIGCPQWRTHRGAIMKTVRILRETKNRFRSKELGQLRMSLEALFEDDEASFDDR